MRYKQDLAEFLSIADGARLIQERAGITEDEAREDIVAFVRDHASEVRWFRVIRGERRRCYTSDLPHGFLDSLTPNHIDWGTSIARRRSVYVPFTVEIEVRRNSLDRLWPDGGVVPPDSEDAKDTATVGRPSQREKIEEAYTELEEENKINFNGPKTALYEPIRKRVRKKLKVPLEKPVLGLGDEAIRLAIAPLFDHDKAARQ